MATYNDTTNETGVAADAATSQLQFPVSLADTPTFSSTLTNLRRPGSNMADTVALSEAYTPASKRYLTQSETAAIASSLLAGRPVSLSDNPALASTARGNPAPVLRDTMGVLESLLGPGKYARGLVETVGVADALNRFIAGTLADGLGMETTLLAPRSFTPAIDDGMILQTPITPYFILRALAEDSIDIEPAQLMQWVFNPELSEAVEISAGFILPDDSFTTWVVNTGTGATTEYSNYVFNSFVRSSNKYLGANSSGLYELIGDTDDGTDIIAEIRGGFFQFAGAHLSSFKAAYLGTRGGGDYVLKLQTADDKEYVYAVKSNSMQTTKINLGKGLRARYWSYELISTGQDFSLESIEFVPLVAQRRV